MLSISVYLVLSLVAILGLGQTVAPISNSETNYLDMPVATSRRKKPARRQASSDIEDEATQGRAARDEVDEDEDEDDAPSRVKKEKAPVKKEKGAAKGKSARAPEEVEDDDDDEDDRIDIDNFADQPLTKADTTKINGLMADWKAVEGAMHQNAAIISHVAVSMAEVSNGEEGQEVCVYFYFSVTACRQVYLQSLEELDRVMKGLIDVRAVMLGHSEVLNEILQAVARGDEDIVSGCNAL